MFYAKKIKYLDYYEGGTKVGSGGFVKLEVRDGILRLEMTVRGLHPTDSFERDVVLRGAEKEGTLGQIRIQNGCGEFRYSDTADKKIGGTDISYEELSGIRISIGGTREILCEWENAPVKKAKAPRKPEPEEPKEMPEREPDADTSDVREENAGAPVEMETEGAGVKVERREIEEKAVVEKETANKETEEREAVETKTVETIAEKKETVEKQNEEKEIRQAEMEATAEPESAQNKRDSGKKATVKLLEDKWQQLSAIYPHIQPFQDERDYLSLTPSDFVLFPTRFYRAVNNSFLLHGYYNYHHLILARVERRGEILYYIGVPGNYFEREKQVAIMFGFESFECEAEPAKTGDFGYYLMRTEL